MLVGCGTAAPGPEGSSRTPSGAGNTTPPSVDLGADMDGLTGRERDAVKRLLDESYAPCTDEAVSLAACLAEKRACRACEPAAHFMVERVRAGLSFTDSQHAYNIRFGAGAHQVEAADSPVRGPGDAPVTVMVWSDFQCPACRRIVPLVEAVVDAHAKDVRLVHKFYPITNKHPQAELAAHAAFAAQRQGRYWQMEKLLFENQQKLHEEMAMIDGLAKDLGLDLDRFHKDMSDAAGGKVIARDVADAEHAGLMGTPFILINGREFDLSLFRPEKDLETWVTTEIDLAKR